jgi:hypothetical protein
MALADPFLATARNLAHRHLRRKHRRAQHAPPCRVTGFEGAGIKKPKGRALVIFAPEALQSYINGAPPLYFNPAGAMIEIAHALTECSFIVDAIGITDCEFTLTERYDLLVAHAGSAYSKFGELVGPQCKVIDYSTGCHWKAYDAQSAARYGRFAASRGITVSKQWERPLNLEEENYAAARADLVVCLGPETAKTFEPVARKVCYINNSAFVTAIPRPVGFAAHSRLNFYYQGGPGNIQKGLDLLFEAFADEPNLHLFFDSVVDNDVLKTYKRELRSSNIHYSEFRTLFPIGHNHLINSCAFVVHAGMNSGQSTALVGALAHGLIPVVARESNLALEGIEVSIADHSIAAIRHAIRHAASLPNSEIERRAVATIAAFQRDFSPAAYRAGFKRAIESLIS